MTVQLPPKKIFSPRRKRHSIVDFAMMKEQDVANEFMTLPGAISVGQGDESFVYVPGTRDDKVLLVAHRDHVWGDSVDIEVSYCDGKYFSLKKGVGIGADDRAGCAMLWKLRNLGHSLLIPNGEESGCVGSRFLMGMEEWRKRINNEHRFAIEMDRRGNNDLVFYSVGSFPFTKWCEKNFRGYSHAHGSYTDICQLCDTICGLNISIGYYNQHGDGEYLMAAEWARTLGMMKEVLSQKDIPKFEQIKWKQPDYSHGYTNNASTVGYCGNTYRYKGRRGYRKKYNDSDEYFRDKYPLLEGSRGVEPYNFEKREEKSNIDYSITESIMVCLYCDFIQDEGEYNQNKKKCVSCNKEF